LYGIASAEEISGVEVNIENKTLDITITDLEIGESYEVYSVIEGDDYSFAFFATNETETISVEMDKSCGFYKIRKVLTSLATSFNTIG
jgi:hypothetical protein